MKSRLLVAVTIATCLGLSGSSFGQDDIDSPVPDVNDPNGRPDIPTRVDSLELPDVRFIFDGLLDPDRVSLIESVTADNMDDPRLTAAARSIIRNHVIAMQQVELAIQFLQANRDNILAGTNSQFNSVFGNPGEVRDVAIVNPEPISGTANVRASNTGLIELDFQDQDEPNLPGQLRVGDFVFVGDAQLSPPDPSGFVMEVEQILFDDDGDNQSALGTSLFGGAITTQNRGNIPVHRVIGFEQRTDPSRFDRVVQTFTAIRDSLSGFDPNPNVNILQSQSDITYQRDFEDINDVWAPGIAQFTALDEIVRRELDRTGLTSTRAADRLVRQAGFSNSDSHFHIDRLDDQGFDQATDYQGRATFPLLWTEDNEVPLQFASNAIVPGASDEDRAFFRDRQTIFGEPDNPFHQYIGRAFLEETIFHAEDFFDDTIAVVPDTVSKTTLELVLDPTGLFFTLQPVTRTQSLDSDTDLARRPVRGPRFDLDGDGNIDIFDSEDRSIPESGVAITANTDLRKWQMIIESFAEHSTDLELFNVAAIGVEAMFGDFAPDDLRARDAGNYAEFAAMIGGNNGLGLIDVTRIEPFGKRGTAGFNPVVPRN